MNIAVTDDRLASFSSPSVFALGETTPLTITGIADADDSTLVVALFSRSGALYAQSSTLSMTEGVVTGEISCATTSLAAAFAALADAAPDSRIPAVIVIADAERVWASTGIEIVNNPLAYPTEPGETLTYLTTEMFSGLTPLSSDSTDDERTATLQAIIAILQGN